LQALVGGSVDVVTGAYEHTVRMQAKGQDVRGVAELGRFPSITVAVRKEHAGTVKSAADFKGKKIGVTAPGSSTYLIPLYAMSKAGLKASDASFIGVGATASAVAAIQRGEIDIISNTEPVISKLEQEGAIVPLIDTRTEAGALRRLEPGRDALYAGGVHREESRDDAAPGQRLHEVVEMAAGGDARGGGRTVPPEYHLGDKALYVAAVKKSLESYSRDGIVSTEGMNSVLGMLKALDPEMQNATVDLAKTFDDRFVKKSPVK
jgi:NitT/TauT family transport system substrate-binding protein